MNKKGSLVLVGSGIKFVSHLTTEAKNYIEQSEKVLYLVNEPAMQEWIQKTNKSAESLDPIYTSYNLRLDSYRAITEYILDTLRQELHVCVVLYGHPTIVAIPGLEAVKRAKLEGFYTKILPGISAVDCLFADLMIDPGSCGCQSFEATDFLIYQRKFDPSSHLILWQIGSIGILDHRKVIDNSKGAAILLDYLTQFYRLEHDVILFEAAQYPHLESKIETFPLKDLPQTQFSTISTLYIPPIYKANQDKHILKQLNLDIS